MTIARSRVQVWSDRRMVTLDGVVVPVPEGAPVLLSGTAHGIGHPVAVVKLDDGRELLVASADVAVAT